MVFGPDTTNILKPGEEPEVDSLLRAAFPGPEEAILVQRLRAEGDLYQEYTKPWAGRIGGYAAVSRMVSPAGWYALAPVAVWPDWQRGALGRHADGSINGSFHFGTRLVSAIAYMFNDPDGILTRHRAKHGQDVSEPPTLVVFGKPSFYARCGFSLERASRLTSPYPLSHILIARNGDDVPEATLVYPPAFEGV